MTINIKEENFLDSQNVSYNIGYYFTEQFRYYFDITAAAQAWVDGTADPNLGIVFKSTDEFEAGTTLHHRTFGSYNRTGYQPTFIMTYSLKRGTVDEGITKQLSTDMDGTVTWTSSDTSLATVDATGKVTGVRAGQVTITASCPGYADVEFSIWVTVPTGAYYIKNASANFYLQDNAGQTSLYVKDTGTLSRTQQLWKISYVSDGCYAIRPMSDLSLALTVDDDGLVAVADTEDSNYALTSEFLWKITYNSNGYAIQLVGNPAQTMMPTTGVQPNATVSTGTWTAAASCHWNLDSVDGIFLRDKSTLKASTVALRIGIDLGSSVDDSQYFSMEVYGDHSGVTWTSSNTSVASIDSNGKVTGNTLGTSVITLTATFNGTTYAAFYLAVVCLPRSGYELDYQPELWNDLYVSAYYDEDSELLITEGTNCYSYALNVQVNPYTNALLDMQPGYGLNSGKMWLPEEITGDNIIKFVKQDAENLGFVFEEISKYEVCDPGCYKVALVIDEYKETEYENEDENENKDNADFHWYRQNSDGTWSHKNGGSKVTDLDASGNLIYDPQAADRDYSDQINCNYEVFIGFYQITPLNYLHPDVVSGTAIPAAAYALTNGNTAIAVASLDQVGVSQDELLQLLGPPDHN